MANPFITPNVISPAEKLNAYNCGLCNLCYNKRATRQTAQNACAMRHEFHADCLFQYNLQTRIQGCPCPICGTITANGSPEESFGVSSASGSIPFVYGYGTVPHSGPLAVATASVNGSFPSTEYFATVSSAPFTVPLPIVNEDWAAFKQPVAASQIFNTKGEGKARSTHLVGQDDLLGTALVLKTIQNRVSSPAQTFDPDYGSPSRPCYRRSSTAAQTYATLPATLHSHQPSSSTIPAVASLHGISHQPNISGFPAPVTLPAVSNQPRSGLEAPVTLPSVSYAPSLSIPATSNPKSSSKYAPQRPNRFGSSPPSSTPGNVGPVYISPRRPPQKKSAMDSLRRTAESDCSITGHNTRHFKATPLDFGDPRPWAYATGLDGLPVRPDPFNATVHTKHGRIVYQAWQDPVFTPNEEMEQWRVEKGINSPAVVGRLVVDENGQKYPVFKNKRWTMPAALKCDWIQSPLVTKLKYHSAGPRYPRSPVLAEAIYEPDEEYALNKARGQTIRRVQTKPKLFDAGFQAARPLPACMSAPSPWPAPRDSAQIPNPYSSSNRPSLSRSGENDLSLPHCSNLRNSARVPKPYDVSKSTSLTQKIPSGSSLHKPRYGYCIPDSVIRDIDRLNRQDQIGAASAFSDLKGVYYTGAYDYEDEEIEDIPPLGSPRSAFTVLGAKKVGKKVRWSSPVFIEPPSFLGEVAKSLQARLRKRKFESEKGGWSSGCKQQ